jgi:hypothetical protein
MFQSFAATTRPSRGRRGWPRCARRWRARGWTASSCRAPTAPGRICRPLRRAAGLADRLHRLGRFAVVLPACGGRLRRRPLPVQVRAQVDLAGHFTPVDWPARPSPATGCGHAERRVIGFDPWLHSRRRWRAGVTLSRAGTSSTASGRPPAPPAGPRSASTPALAGETSATSAPGWPRRCARGPSRRGHHPARFALLAAEHPRRRHSPHAGGAGLRHPARRRARHALPGPRRLDAALPTISARASRCARPRPSSPRCAA